MFRMRRSSFEDVAADGLGGASGLWPRLPRVLPEGEADPTQETLDRLLEPLGLRIGLAEIERRKGRTA